jgi:hypothetical protein
MRRLMFLSRDLLDLLRSLLGRTVLGEPWILKNNVSSVEYVQKIVPATLSAKILAESTSSMHSEGELGTKRVDKRGDERISIPFSHPDTFQTVQQRSRQSGTDTCKDLEASLSVAETSHQHRSSSRPAERTILPLRSQSPLRFTIRSAHGAPFV